MSWTLKHYRGQRVQPTGMGLLGLVGLSLSLGCATAPPPPRLATVTTARRPPASPVRVFIPKVNACFDTEGRFIDAEILQRLRNQAEGFARFCEMLNPELDEVTSGSASA